MFLLSEYTSILALVAWSIKARLLKRAIPLISCNYPPSPSCCFLQPSRTTSKVLPVLHTTQPFKVRYQHFQLTKTSYSHHGTAARPRK